MGRYFGQLAALDDRLNGLRSIAICEASIIKVKCLDWISVYLTRYLPIIAKLSGPDTEDFLTVCDEIKTILSGREFYTRRKT